MSSKFQEENSNFNVVLESGIPLFLRYIRRDLSNQACSLRVSTLRFIVYRSPSLIQSTLSILAQFSIRSLGGASGSSLP